MIQELKAQTRVLVDWVVFPSNLYLLLSLVSGRTGTAKEQAVAAELFNCGVQAVSDAVIADAAALRLLTAVFEAPAPLPALTATNTVKVMGTLFSRNAQAMVDGLGEAVLGHILGHLGSYPVVELLLRLVSNEEAWDHTLTMAWLGKAGLGPLLAAKVVQGQNVDEHKGAVEIFSSILERHRDAPNDLVLQLFGREVVETLLRGVFMKGTERGSLACLTALVSCTLPRDPALAPAANTSGVTPRGAMGFFGADRANAFLDGVGDDDGPGAAGQGAEGGAAAAAAALPRAELYDLVRPKMWAIFETLQRDPRHPITNTAGTLDPPLGGDRLAVVTLFCQLVRVVEDEGIVSRICEFNVIKKAVSLCQTFEWCSILHSVVTRMVRYALESDCAELHNQVVGEADLPAKVLESRADCAERAAAKRPAHGFSSHYIQIANLLEKHAAKPAIASALQSTPGWAAFAAGELAAVNELNTRRLGDRPSAASDPERRAEINSGSRIAVRRGLAGAMEGGASSNPADTANRLAMYISSGAGGATAAGVAEDGASLEDHARAERNAAMRYEIDARRKLDPGMADTVLHGSDDDDDDDSDDDDDDSDDDSDDDDDDDDDKDNTNTNNNNKGESKRKSVGGDSGGSAAAVAAADDEAARLTAGLEAARLATDEAASGGGVEEGWADFSSVQ